jgi:putative ABC transport system permease protein
MVISTGDLAELLTRTIFTLFTFVAAIAALALLAGAVLIANAVGLGLLERRRELAMLKALGYSQAQVLRVVLLENGMLGLIGSLFGLLGTFTAATIFNSTLPQANLQLHLPGSVVLILVGTALCAGTALAVAWPATRVRPLFVLREE